VREGEKKADGGKLIVKLRSWCNHGFGTWFSRADRHVSCFGSGTWLYRAGRHVSCFGLGTRLYRAGRHVSCFRLGTWLYRASRHMCVALDLAPEDKQTPQVH
jgi:hypothetical protein